MRGRLDACTELVNLNIMCSMPLFVCVMATSRSRVARSSIGMWVRNRFPGAVCARPFQSGTKDAADK